MSVNKKIYIGSDHAGLLSKQNLIKRLKKTDYDVIDLGTYNCESVDYPDYAFAVAEKVSQEHTRGILICGSGVGVCIAANKVAGIRAALVYDPKLAALVVKHDDANILCLSGRFISNHKNFKIVLNFLKAKFEGERHSKRVDKIENYEKQR